MLLPAAAKAEPNSNDAKEFYEFSGRPSQSQSAMGGVHAVAARKVETGDVFWFFGARAVLVQAEDLRKPVC